MICPFSSYKWVKINKLQKVLYFTLGLARLKFMATPLIIHKHVWTCPNPLYDEIYFKNHSNLDKWDNEEKQIVGPLRRARGQKLLKNTFEWLKSEQITGRPPCWITLLVWLSLPVTTFPRARKAGVTILISELANILTRFGTDPESTTTCNPKKIYIKNVVRLPITRMKNRCGKYRLFFLRSIAQFFTQIYMDCYVSS